MTQIVLPNTSKTTADANNFADVYANDAAIQSVVNGNLDNANIAASAGIVPSKLAAATAGSIYLANGSGVITAVVPTGDVTVNSSGVTAIGSGKVTSTHLLDGTIVNADVNASAALAYSKLALTNSIVAGDLTTSSVTPTKVSSWPGVSLYKSATQSILDSTDTVLTFPNANESFDTDTMHTSNDGKITFTTAGIYVIAGGVAWEANATGRRELGIVGLDVSPANTLTSTPSGAPAFQGISGIVSASAASYIELHVWQNSTSSLNAGVSTASGIAGGFTRTYFSAFYLGKGT